MSSDSIEKNCSIHLNAEIEINLLRKALADKQIELNNLKSECYEESDRRGEIEDVVLAWQDKFERLFESYKKIHKVNQNLEDKLLKLVDRNSGERAKLTTDCTILNIRLRQANCNITSLQKDIDRYKQDINLAIQLLHCKPNNFYSQNINSLPANMQSKIASYMKLDGEERNKVFSSKGRYQMLPTNDDNGKDDEIINFSSMSSLNASCESNNKVVTPNVIADFLENEIKSKNSKHCETCSCSKKNSCDEMMLTHLNASTQTDISTLHCIRCSSDLNSPSHTNSPYFMKLKSSDSVISETKSSVSDFTNQNDKAFSPTKNESDLLVNPVLGHHRLCDFRNFHTNNHIQKDKYDDELARKCDTASIKSICNDKNSLHKSTAMGGSGSVGGGVGCGNVSGESKLKSTGEKNISSSMSHGPGNGSNNSIWSRTSSKECAKIFENFNRNLIKAMKAEYPRKNAPRICALKIQDESNNILLDNNDKSGKKEVIYRRRSRLLDDAFLEDEKNNIPTNIPINLESSQSSQNNDSVILSVESNQNSSSIPSSSKIETQTKDNSINQHEDIMKKDSESNKNRCFDLSHNDNELNDNIMYRKQKFVAEWLQNSSNIPKSSPTSTKTTTVLDVDAAIKNNIKELDYENNNSTEASFSSSSVQLKQNTFSESISNAQDETYVDKLKMDNKLLLTNSGSDEYEDDCNMIQQKDENSSNVDLVQMEYNVRKFLLKQHEWSMTSVFQNDLNDLYLSDDEEPIFVRRTETNL